MANVAKWFDRKFDFSFSVELYPNLCSRLRGTPARLEETVRNCPQEPLVRKNGESWSAQEHAGHLLDLEPLWLARVRDFLSGGTTLTAADLTNRKTHDANHNSRPIEEILREFRRQRFQLLSEVELQDSASLSRSLVHPRLNQPMRLLDHLYFVAEHDDHHLAWIHKLLSKPSANG